MGQDLREPVALVTEQATPGPDLRHVYPVLLAAVWATWLVAMFLTDGWSLFREFWPVSVTMSLGSFVAGATAEGGAAVAFPVFTKVLHIEPQDARTFGLMIQAVGMTMAGVVIVTRRVPILPRVIGWVSLGGVAGQVVGTYWLQLGSPGSKILFTFAATVFGVALAISRWWLDWSPLDRVPGWTRNKAIVFVAIGVVGGAFAANTGSGIDMLTFIVLTLALGVNEKVSTPTTVIIMAINSIVGFALHGLVVHDIGVAYDYWMVAIPIVVVGAPLGAFVASHAQRDHIIWLLLTLITIELVSTLVLVPFDTAAIWLTVIASMTFAGLFALMLRYRSRTLGGVQHRSPKLATRG